MIYFIRHSEYVKIGYTNDILKRLSHLQVSSPVKLEVLALVEGDISKEREYQEEFKHLSCSGEWFNYNEELQKFTNSLPLDLMWKYGFIEFETSIIGEIKKERLKQNLSMEELAEKLNVSRQAIQDMESREIQGRVSIVSLHKVAKALGCKLQYRLIKV